MAKRIMTLLELKCGHWSSRFDARPTAFALDKTLFSLLLFFLVLQIMSGLPGPVVFSSGARLSIWMLAGMSSCIVNILQLLYFPCLLDRMIGADFFHLFPLTSFQLNGIRIAESFFTKSSLLTANIMFMPTLLIRQDHHGVLVFFSLTLLLIRMLSIFLADMLRSPGKAFILSLLPLAAGGLGLSHDLPLFQWDMPAYFVYEATRNDWICLAVIACLFLMIVRLYSMRFHVMYKQQIL